MSSKYLRAFGFFIDHQSAWHIKGRKSNIRRRDPEGANLAACDALANSGKKPSVASVRPQTMVSAGIKRGSNGVVQEDIRLWYEDPFALKHDAAIAGIPEPMAALFPETWRGAVELAEEGVSDTRARLERDRDRAAVKVDRAPAVSDALRHELAMAKKAVEAPMPPHEVNRP